MQNSEGIPETSIHKAFPYKIIKSGKTAEDKGLLVYGAIHKAM